MPSPVPSSPFVVKNVPNSLLFVSSSMPVPVSATVSAKLPGTPARSQRTVSSPPPSRMAYRAFVARLSRIWLMAPGLPSSQHGSSVTSGAKRTSRGTSVRMVCAVSATTALASWRRDAPAEERLRTYESICSSISEQRVAMPVTSPAASRRSSGERSSAAIICP